MGNLLANLVASQDCANYDQDCSRIAHIPGTAKSNSNPVIHPRTSLTNDRLGIQHALNSLSEGKKAAMLKEIFVRDMKTAGLVLVAMLGLAAIIAWVLIKKRATQAKRLPRVKGIVDEENRCEEKNRTGWGA